VDQGGDQWWTVCDARPVLVGVADWQVVDLVRAGSVLPRQEKGVRQAAVAPRQAAVGWRQANLLPRQSGLP
jgi:hypothetical protein